jgi:hypothetical protein
MLISILKFVVAVVQFWLLIEQYRIRSYDLKNIIILKELFIFSELLDGLEVGQRMLYKTGILNTNLEMAQDLK